jgi:hypothetical protein
MHSIITPEVANSGKHVRTLSNIACINGIKSEGMRASHEGNALVERNDAECYTMDDVPPPFPTIKSCSQRVSSMGSVRATTYAWT